MELCYALLGFVAFHWTGIESSLFIVLNLRPLEKNCNHLYPSRCGYW